VEPRGTKQDRIATVSTHTAYRRSELQATYAKFEAEIETLNQRVEEQAWGRARARLLMTHLGVGPVTALATEVFPGDPTRFADSKALASYAGMIAREYSSGGRQRLGGLSKQGNPLLRFLWGEAGAHAVSRDPELQRFYRRKLILIMSGEGGVYRDLSPTLSPRRRFQRVITSGFTAPLPIDQSPEVNRHRLRFTRPQDGDTDRSS
jgi:transposase